MPQTENLVTITQVTDDSTGNYHVGEIDGLFQDHTLHEYLKRYGLQGQNDLLTHLAYLQHQVIAAYKEVTYSENTGQQTAKLEVENE